MSYYSDGLPASRYNMSHNPVSGEHSDASSRWHGAVPPDQRGRSLLLYKRERLIKAMGLAYDPFSSGVSERDLAPDFGSIYVDTLPGLLDSLIYPETSCLLADYGMGKTATRYALEYFLRLARTPTTLCVSYSPSLEALAASQDNLLQAHLDAIAAELRIDLMVQYIERLPERQAERDGDSGYLTSRAISRQAPLLPGHFLRSLRAASDLEQAEGSFWRPLRPVVRHVAPTPAWRSLLDQIVRAARAAVQPASWEETVFDAASLGFSQIFILVDAIDNGGFEADAYLEVVRPLLAVASELERHAIYLKLFLPREIRFAIEAVRNSTRQSLTLPRMVATIDKISIPDLDRILSDRLEAARTSEASFASLDWFGQELGESVQGRLVEAACGSPRRLIELASALIDFHSLNGFYNEERLWLTPVEWQAFLHKVEGFVSSPS